MRVPVECVTSDSKMSSFMKRREQNVQKPFPGCMGSMINIFDLSAGMAGTKLLTEIPHSDAGSTTIRNHSDLLKRLPDVVNHTTDKQSMNDQRRCLSNKKPTATPVKKLMAQEMREEAKQRQKSPTVVARLMGLDSLPVQQSVPIDRQNVELGYSYKCSAAGVRTSQRQSDAHFNKQVAFFSVKKEYKDVHEIWQQPLRTNQTRDHYTQKEIYEENVFQKRMALVQHKFIEAKRLAKDEKLLKSKGFQDAIEILRSSRELFPKFLEESNPLFSKHHFEHRSVSPPRPKRITVLKPAREKESHKASDGIVSKTSQPHRSSSFPGTRIQELSEPTRIVVLKPSPGKLNDAEAMVAPSVSSPKPVDGQGPFGSLHTKQAMNSRELAKEITLPMRESLSGQIRDGDLLSLFLSNGYIGDDSSFNRTETECIEEEVGSRSDSDIASPNSQHSWDFLDRIGSPHSISSFSRASHSPESSVVAEAKKRLSERLTLVASNVNEKQQRIEMANSRTLGEMLAIPETKKEGNANDSSIKVINEINHSDLGTASNFLSPDFMEDGCSFENSSRSLARSKSVPLSSFGYEAIESHVGSCNPLISGPIIQNDVPKSKNVKSSFTGKLSSFFFSKSKKQNREDMTTSSSQNCEVIHSVHGTSHCKLCDGSYHVNDSCLEESESINPDKKSSCSTAAHDGADQEAFPLEKLSMCENSTQNQDEPSPISVLEAPFKDDIISCSHQSENVFTGHPQALSRSPPIESIARSLSRVGPYLKTTSLYPLKPSRVLSKVDEEQEQYMIVKKLISSAGFGSSKSSSFSTTWYSLEIPLNPMLLEEYMYSKDEGVSCREGRSNSRLMFDCINMALLGMSLRAILAAGPWCRTDGKAFGDSIPDASLIEEVWGIIRSWSSGENSVQGACSNISIMVEMMVKIEVTGRQWSESMWLESYEFSKEISWKLLEELVEEALSDFIKGSLN